ncbi:hypothetical protein ACIHAR_36940 [Streptomyces sp. NPDC052016]|uniref:hypothetical protein n=1 Tax=Streptomyces sp. NPDC052016 TaxID=3365680 RepID=UPI0037D751A0
MPSSRPDPEAHTGDDRTTDLIRWAAFSCVLVPVVLLWYGSSLAGAAGTALGLAAVTAACRLLLRRSERYAARTPAERRKQQQTRESQESRAPQRAQAPYGPGSPAPRTPRRGRRQRTGTGSHRGGRHSGGSTPVG